MPLFLEFKSHIKDKSYSTSEAEEFCRLILNTPFIIHVGSLINISTSGNEFKINMEIKGLCLIDDESKYMLHSLLTDKLLLEESPFYVSEIKNNIVPTPGEAIFRHERFIPSRSRNALLISQLPHTNVPDEYICPLSSEIIDVPVFDIRTPQINYDYNFLMYWLNKSASREMPHTRLPCSPCFLKTNYKLKFKIDSFVEQAQMECDNKNLEELLLRCKLDKSSRDIIVLNQALRRSAAFGTEKDLSLLLKWGADVNAQDNVPEKRFTALHIALDRKNIRHAKNLLHSGAKIDIKNAQNVTAHEMILQINDINVQMDLLYTCKLLKLLPVHHAPTVTNNQSFFRASPESTNQTATAMSSSPLRGAAHN